MLMFILQKNNFFDPFHDVIGGQGKKGTKFIIRQRNGLCEICHLDTLLDDKFDTEIGYRFSTFYSMSLSVTGSSFYMFIVKLYTEYGLLNPMTSSKILILRAKNA